MTKKISRRSFIKESTAVGVATLVGGAVFSGISGSTTSLIAGEMPDISVVKGDDFFKSTVKAIEMLGGMNKYVKKGSKVAILANPQRNNPGAYTKPPLVAAAIRMCKEAGAAEIACISLLPIKNWENTGLKEALDKEGAKLIIADRKNESQFKSVPIPKGRTLKEARIMNEFFNYDVLIDIPITKDHAGNKFTGTMKNLMGLNSQKCNRTFHKPNWKTDIEDIKHLDQSIADLNTVVAPTLCIVDATEFIITNGPFGPGKLHKPHKVIAGTDRVAIDAYCSTLWNLDPKDIFTITMAHQHGLGEIDLTKVKIKVARA
jgi:uncharacterized protein (DUF362 family)